MARPKGLGKGLDVLFQQKIPLDEEDRGENNYRDIDIDLLEANPDQPRKSFSEESIQELAESITAKGLIQPIVVRPSPQTPGKYQIVAGERRYLACKKAGISKVKVIVTELSDEDALIIGLIENLQREDLNCIEEAEAYSRLKQNLNLTQEELAREIGKSRSYVANTLRLLSLEEEIRIGLKSGTITAGHARALLSISSSEARKKAYEYIAQKGLSVRESEKIAEHFRKKGELPRTITGIRRNTSVEKEFSKVREEIKRIFKERLGIKATLSGSLEKGKLTLSFDSPEKLKFILTCLTPDMEGNTPEIVSRETMENRDETIPQ